MHITSQYDVLADKDGAPTALKKPYATDGFSMILVKDSDCSPPPMVQVVSAIPHFRKWDIDLQHNHLADLSTVAKFADSKAESKKANVQISGADLILGN